MKTFEFYGVCGNCYKLDNKVWEALEDPSDGYRSYLQSIECIENPQDLIFFPRPLATVKVVQTSDTKGEVSGWKLIDVSDGHEWLEVGTDYSDDYYPQFVFRYTPKVPESDWDKFIRGE